MSKFNLWNTSQAINSLLFSNETIYIHKDLALLQQFVSLSFQTIKGQTWSGESYNFSSILTLRIVYKRLLLIDEVIDLLGLRDLESYSNQNTTFIPFILLILTQGTSYLYKYIYF